jgi:hypothetical protein
LGFVQEHADRFHVERVKLSEFPHYGDSPHLNEEAIRLADLSRPILLAEISPGHYSVIDGNHRLANRGPCLSAFPRHGGRPRSGTAAPAVQKRTLW